MEKAYTSETYYSQLYSEDIKEYTEEWFGSHKLVMVLLREFMSAPDCHKVTNVTRNKVEIDRTLKMGDTVISYWHIFIEVDKDADISNDFEVVITDTTNPEDHSFGSIA